MKELVCEVHERFHCLLLAFFCIVESVLLMVLSRLVTGDDSKARWAMFLFGLFILCAAGYMILAFLNHRLKVFSDGSMHYSTFLGMKTDFSYTDVAEIEPIYQKGLRNRKPFWL